MKEAPQAFSMDSDGNIAHTKTPVFLLQKEWTTRKEIQVTQRQFDEMIIDGESYRYIDDDFQKSAQLFRTPGNYLNELIDALENKQLWPSYPIRIEAATKAAPFFTNTARGVSIQELMQGHRLIIYEYLDVAQREELVDNMRKNLGRWWTNKTRIIEKYLLNNRYYGTSHDEFNKRFGTSQQTPTRVKKQLAFADATTHAQYLFKQYYGPKFEKNPRFSHGFSDDSIHNITAIQQLIQNTLLQEFPHTTFVTYNTYDENNIIKEKFGPLK